MKTVQMTWYDYRGRRIRRESVAGETVHAAALKATAGAYDLLKASTGPEEEFYISGLRDIDPIIWKGSRSHLRTRCSLGLLIAQVVHHQNQWWASDFRGFPETPIAQPIADKLTMLDARGDRPLYEE